MLPKNCSAAKDYDLMKYKLSSDALGIGLWDMIVINGDPVNINNKIIWSQEIRQMLGFKDEQDFPDVLRSLIDRIHPDERENAFNKVVAHIKDSTGKIPFDIEHRIMLKNGEYRYFHSFGNTQRNSEGVPVRIAGALRDIDVRKKAQNELMLMSSIAHNSPNFIAFKKYNGECLYVNPAASVITGYSRDELMKDYLGLLFGAKAPEYLAATAKEIREKGVAKYEYEAKMKNGDIKIFAGTSFPVNNDSFATIASDITEAKKIEIERMQAHETMQNILNGFEAMIYATVPETGEILFINEYMKRHYELGDDIMGQFCYKVLQSGMENKCGFCPCYELDKNPESVVVWEERSTLTNRIYRNVDRYIDWLDGKKAHIQYSVDISDLMRTQESLKKMTVDLQKALHEAQEANRANSKFMSRIIHLEAETEKVYIDGLTNIYNRRYFDEAIERELKSLSRAGGTLSLMMIDIDFFKKYNDTYGHSAGDDCLKIIAKILSESVKRTDDFVARYGGEEFVAAMPNTDEAGACKIAEKMLENIWERNILHEQSDAASCVTVSIGVATGSVTRNSTADDFIKRADEMLYKSKQSGRNRYNFKYLQNKS